MTGPGGDGTALPGQTFPPGRRMGLGRRGCSDLARLSRPGRRWALARPGQTSRRCRLELIPVRASKHDRTVRPAIGRDLAGRSPTRASAIPQARCTPRLHRIGATAVAPASSPRSSQGAPSTGTAGPSIERTSEPAARGTGRGNCPVGVMERQLI